MERLTNIGSNGEIWIIDNDYTMAHGRKESAFAKLAEYEDLEDRLHGISIKQLVDGFIKTAENLTHEGYENGRILTNKDADRWNEYKNAEEQGLLLKPPFKVGDTVYVPHRGKIQEMIIQMVSWNGTGFFFSWTLNSGIYPWLDGFGDMNIGKTVFLKQAEAEQKLKEMEGD